MVASSPIVPRTAASVPAAGPATVPRPATGAPPAFQITARCPVTRARAGVLSLPHALVQTPVFMPVGTAGSIKTLSSEDVEALGFDLILANTYHLHLRPGDALVRAQGGLHRFMAWPRGILTDSGGFQVFSLSTLRRVTEDGVAFRSHIDGRKLMLTPELSAQIQLNLGSDVAMAFDECIPYPAEQAFVKLATERSLRWTQRSHREFVSRRETGALFFGIVQGGMIDALRRWSAQEVARLAPDGLAIGGLSVGEPRDLFLEVLERTLEWLPGDRPRYLMGVGTLGDIARAVAMGVDMFDCVMPTRLARHGHVFTLQGKINIQGSAYATDQRPLDPHCACRSCARYTRAYVHHLMRAGEALGPRLATFHNLHFYRVTMDRVRQAVAAGTLSALALELAALDGRSPA